MKSYAIVSTKGELKQALDRKADKIIVIDPDLAANIKNIKFVSRACLVAAIGAGGVAATNFWNPVGFSAAFVGAAAGGSTMVAIVTLGIGAALVWAIYNDYNIKVKGKVKMPDGKEVEAEIVLEKN